MSKSIILLIEEEAIPLLFSTVVFDIFPNPHCLFSFNPS